jgi:GR25 family glycosyltransferase involved in LPS biosynthesis
MVNSQDQIMKLENYIDNIYIINLKNNLERKKYIIEYFSKLKLNKYIFFSATNSRDKIVKTYYNQGKIFQYPPCFRCGRESCNCDNNILIPQQIANWISFLRLWQKIAAFDAHKNFMICEDDVYFYDYWQNNLDFFFTEFYPQNINSQEPFLLKLAQSGLPLTSSSQDPCITNKIVMSNVCYILNAKMAKFLLNTFGKIIHTSDVYVHQIIPLIYPNLQIYTLEPLIATDLSFNKDTAKFMSNIHPKGINEKDIKRQEKHIKRVNSVDEYEDYIRQIMRQFIIN